MQKTQDCLQCGKCCEKRVWDQKGTAEDIRPWIKKGRINILRHVGIRFSDITRCIGTEVAPDDLSRITRIESWVDDKNRKMRRCPFFCREDDGKVYCRIHGAKPKVCTRFTPWNEGIRDYTLNCPACSDSVP